MNRLAAEQARRNRLRDGEWQWAANHRGEVTRRLVSLAAPQKRVCILGAGNCNDLDLAALAGAYREIHLVDIDGEALHRGMRRQSPPSPARIFLHGGIELTGIGDALAARSDAGDWHPPAADDPLATADEPGNFGLSGPFEVVASVGVLSQLIDGVNSTVPEQVPWRWPLLFAVRTGHLRLCARLAAPGGHGFLATDFVSSVTCPGLADTPESELPALVEQLAAQRNFFHGLNPVLLPSLFASDVVLRELTLGAQPNSYWLWHQRARCFAVLGLTFRLACAAA